MKSSGKAQIMDLHNITVSELRLVIHSTVDMLRKTSNKCK
jgi:hypothetical protein